MSNFVLYRKYRPRNFKDIIGQEHVVQTLTNAISSGHTSHGYLFAGPHGSGKTTTARLLAKSLNCENRKEGNYEPCNKCSSCKEINQESAIDLIEIDAASNRGIEEIRELKEGIGFLPTKSKYKVFIIDEAHQLTKEAANALLKTLEEPPAHTFFILATTEAHKMIPTIISRCQRFDFRKLTSEEIIKRLETLLKGEGVKYEPEAVNLIAVSANGSERDAESLLEQVISFAGKGEKLKKDMVKKLLGLADENLIFEFINYLSQKQSKEEIQFLNQIAFQGIDLQEFTRSLIQYFRTLLLLQIEPNLQTPLIKGLNEESKEKLISLSKSFSLSDLKNIIEKFSYAKEKMKYSSVPQLPLELVIVEICQQK